MIPLHFNDGPKHTTMRLTKDQQNTVCRKEQLKTLIIFPQVFFRKGFGHYTC